MAGQTIHVAVAVNDSFIMPLLVMLRSAGSKVSAGWRLEVFVFGYEITEASRAWLESGLEGLPVSVRWKSLDLSGVAKYWPGMRQDGDITCYYRLFLGDALPDTVERVLFLDADLLVEGDLAGLWRLPFDGYVVQAVPDAYARLLHTPRLARIQFTENIRFSPETLYFNAGVQLIDLHRWRDERIGQRAGEFLWKYGGALTGRDQDALNCALVGRWKRLAPTWNLHELPEHAATWHDGGASAEECKEAWRNPAIIHFVGEKPWSEAWRPHQSGRWWKEARRAGVAEVHRSWTVAAWDALVWGPHTRLQWSLRREEWSRIASQLLTQPWIVVTYPLWWLVRRYS